VSGRALEGFEGPSGHLATRARAFSLFFESRKRSIFLFLYAFQTENRFALFLEML